MPSTAFLFRTVSASLLALGIGAGAGIYSPLQAADIASADAGFDDLLAKAPVLDDTSRWYLRGDVGYVFNETPDWSQFNFLPAAQGQSIDNAWVFGIGAGMRLNDIFRFDLTADYRTRADYTSGGLSARYGSASFLANAYADLGTWHSITPYVGAGIGASYVSASDVSYFGIPLGDVTGWGLTWALMGGVSVSVTSNWQIDIGYRYVDISDTSSKLDFGQSAHEVRIGARYLID